MESLNEIIIKEGGKRRVENERLLKLMSCAKFHQFLTLTCVRSCYHISCVGSDRAWISHKHNLILTNTKGDTIHHREDLCNSKGSHTVNSRSELIYIDKNYDINKSTKDFEQSKTFIKY